MGTGRLEAFSDGVLAVIITIMVLEMKVPSGASLDALRPLGPVFVAYVISFLYVGIYWNNHHHLFHLAEKVGGTVLWANLNLLFWLSLLPWVSGWVGEHPHDPLPAAVYGVLLLFAAFAWLILQRAIVAQGSARLAGALGSDWKGKVSPVLYGSGIALAWVSPWISEALYATVALLWIVPDRRFARAAGGDGHE